MSEVDELVEIVRAWVIKAENDLRAATIMLRTEADGPTDTICFHVQQCIEKYLKALLTWRGKDFPKVHDLNQIVGLLPDDTKVALTAKELRRLTEYATVMRYPGDYEPISIGEARKAVTTARRVRKIIREKLPKEALTRRRLQE